MTSVPTPDPGIYEGIDFDTYLAWDAISNSRINLFRRSPAHFHANVEIESTPSLRLGSLTHCGKFEPLELARRFAVMPPFENDPLNLTAKGEKPDSPKATRFYKDSVTRFKAANADKTIVESLQYDDMVGMVTSLSRHDRAREYFEGDGPCEVSIVWVDPETGLLCKGRIDKLKLNQNRISDLKTYTPQQGHVSPREKFSRAIANYGYHRQMAHYQNGIAILCNQICDTCLGVVENKRPWCVMAAPMADDWLSFGRAEVAETLRDIAHAKASKKWPGYESPDYWFVPSWYGADDEVPLTIDGEELLV